jgi:L-iditol 2-dehydrogenase
MAIAELTGFRRFEVKDYVRESPKPGEVQVRMAAVGICGSDLHHFIDGHIGDQDSVYPMVLGHEPAGVITALGQGVTGWAVGDRVACEPPIYCYHCEWCLKGRHNLCEHVTFMSNPGVPGFFRDHVTLPAVNLLALPADMSFAEASLYEPVSIILHSFRFAQPQLGDTAVVFGAGPIGLSTIAGLKIAGISKIWCVEPVFYRREIAIEMGADVVIDPNQADPVEEILLDTRGRGVDISIDCASQGDTVNQSMYVACPGGRVIITGLPQERRLSNFDFHHMRRKELYFAAIRRSNHTGAAAVELLKEQGHRFKPMLTHCMPMSKVQSAFEMLMKFDDGACKVVLEPEQDA